MKSYDPRYRKTKPLRSTQKRTVKPGKRNTSSKWSKRPRP